VSTSKKVLITGGAGFIGSSLALQLKDTCEVVIFDNLHRNAFEKTVLADAPNVHLIKGDVLDLKGVRDAARGCDTIIHMASIAGVDTVMRNPVLTMKVALQGTMNVLEAAMEEGALNRFVDLSTSEVFGQYAYKVNEGDITQLGAVGEARWTYAVSKLATEHLALNYYKQYKLPAVSIRPFNIYGPRQVGEGAIHHFIVRALNGEDLIIHNDGSQIRAWCYIDDIIDALMLVMKRDEAVGESFNIGNPRSTLTIYNLAREIVRLTGSKSRLTMKDWPFADVELRIPDISKARKLLDYEPKWDLEEGLIETIKWYKGRM
jgi:nucleoside-diphosphate-sugar epimerase